MAIKNGMIVELKDLDGPDMIVSHKNDKGLWICHWVVNDDIREMEFSEEELTEVDDDDDDDD